MSSVYYLSDIGAEAIELVRNYMDKFFPDATMQMIASKGLLNTCKRKIPDSDCVLAILDKEISAEINMKGYTEVFKLDKVHRYTDFSALRDEMIAAFGVDLSENDKVVPPDELGVSQSLSDFFNNYGEEPTETVEPTVEKETVVTEEKPIEKVEETVVESKPTLKETVVETKPIETVKEPTIVETAVEKKSTVKETVVDKAPTVKETAVEKKPTVAETTVAETTVEKKPIEKVEETAVEKQPTIKETAIEKKPTVSESVEVNSTVTKKKDSIQSIQLDTSIEESPIQESTVEDVDFGEILGEENHDAVKIANEDTEALKDKLIQAQMTISSLSSQLEELQDSNDEVLMTRIEVLNAKLESKENEIKTLRQITTSTTENVDVMELSDLREELIKVKESKATLEYDKKKVEGDLALSEERIKELQSSSINLEEQIKALNRQITSNDAKIERLQDEGKEKDSIIADKVAEVEVLNQNSDTLTKQISDLSKQLEETKSELSAVKLERDNLKADLDKVKSDLAQTNATVNEKENLLKDVNAQLEETKKHADDLTETIGELRKQVQDLTEQLDASTNDKEKALADAEDKGKTITRLTEEMDALKEHHKNELNVLNGTVETLTNKASKAKDFKEEISTLNEQVTNLNGQISDLNTQLSNKNSQIETKVSELNIKETELKGYEEREKVTQERLESKDRAYEALSNAKDLMEKDLNSRLTQANDVITQLREQLKNKSSEVTDLTATNSKLSNEISSLSETLDANKPDIVASASLEQELFEAKKTIARLQNESDFLKENSIAKDTLDKANTRVEELEEQLKVLQAEKVKDREDVEGELAELRKRNADLEINLANKSKEAVGIFAQMEKLAVPKVPYNVKISTEGLNLSNKFICVASGSTESNSSVYHMLKRTCMKNNKKKFLILDLVTETSIDRDFGIKKVDFPKEWLSGESDCKKYVAKTSLANTCVISTGFSYLNDLFLLNCSLEEKLREIDMLGATVIVNVGCLNNLVSKVLFNTLSNIMQTYVIVKATPINLRNVILAMTGLMINKNVEVTCVDYDEKASQVLYHKLAQKYNARILQGDEVLLV